MHGRSEWLPALLSLISLPVRPIRAGEGTGEENGASRSSSLALSMLIMDRFSRVMGVVRLAPFRVAILLSDEGEPEQGDELGEVQ